MLAIRSALARRPSALRWARRIQLAGFVYVLWRPVSAPFLLYPLLAAIAVTSLLLAMADPPSIPRWLPRVAITYTAFVVCWAVGSALAHNPGVLPQTLVWGGIPLLWGVWALTLHGPHGLVVMRAAVWTCLISAALLTWYALHAVGWLPYPTLLEGLQGAGFTNSGQLALRYYGLSTFTALAPLVLVAAILGTNVRWAPRRVVVPAAACAFIAGVSSRRAIILVTLMTVAACGVVWLERQARGTHRLPSSPGRRWAAAAATLAFGLVVTVSPLGGGIRQLSSDVGALAAAMAREPQAATRATPTATPTRPTAAASRPAPSSVSAPPTSVVATVRTAQATTGASSPAIAPGSATTRPPESASATPTLRIDDQLRVDQGGRLLAAWRKHWLVGLGFGATISDEIVRSAERPWAFELQYHLMLMNIGVLGTGILAIIAATLAWQVLLAWGRARRSDPPRADALLAAGVGAVAILVANASNPYLQAVGHGWAVFLPLGLALAGRSSQRHDHSADQAVDPGEPSARRSSRKHTS